MRHADDALTPAACSAASTVRPAAVAGLFYAANAGELRREVAQYLEQPPVSGAQPKALLVPHAGLKYSGAIAAAAYARLRPHAAAIRRVVLLGPAHRVAFSGLALPQARAFQTPLGIVPVDETGYDALAGEPGISMADAVHAGEHCLEVQLPFLQAVLGEFTILPLLAGDVQPLQVAQALERVWDGRETLIVISTDLSHFHPDRRARVLDARSCERILAMQPLASGEDACGYVGVNGFLLAARRHRLHGCELARGNSGAVSHDHERVVGYAAFAFHESDSCSN